MTVFDSLLDSLSLSVAPCISQLRFNRSSTSMFELIIGKLNRRAGSLRALQVYHIIDLVGGGNIQRLAALHSERSVPSVDVSDYAVDPIGGWRVRII